MASLLQRKGGFQKGSDLLLWANISCFKVQNQLVFFKNASDCKIQIVSPPQPIRARVMEPVLLNLLII